MEDERKDTLREQPEQAEQPETEKKEANSGMILGMCLGMCVGMAFDSSKKNGKKDDGDADPQA